MIEKCVSSFHGDAEPFACSQLLLLVFPSPHPLSRMSPREADQEPSRGFSDANIPGQLNECFGHVLSFCCVCVIKELASQALYGLRLRTKRQLSRSERHSIMKRPRKVGMLWKCLLVIFPCSVKKVARYVSQQQDDSGCGFFQHISLHQQSRQVHLEVSNLGCFGPIDRACEVSNISNTRDGRLSLKPTNCSS
jgi:hypothetical protein